MLTTWRAVVLDKILDPWISRKARGAVPVLDALEFSLDCLAEDVTVAKDEPDLTAVGVVALAGTAAKPGLGLVQGELVRPSTLEPLGEVVMVGISGGTREAAQLGHELIRERVVILDALHRIVELGTALICRREPQRAMIAKEAMTQVAELDVPVDRGGRIQPSGWQHL
jgi:hypothetical protein